MKRFALFALLALCCIQAPTWAGPDLSQSSPGTKWLSIENEALKLIYPEEMARESAYVANLVEHYSDKVGLSYGIKKPLPFTLLLRPEVATPNGHVSLGPRRSEWFASTTFSPLVGASEWYQTLAIHEYRHLQQYDHYNQGLTKGLSYLFGDVGQQLSMFVGLHSWYFEGDAVWAETKYSDAGRGRSPLFLARLKALILSNQIPTYDEFVNGSYNTLLPNWYVYGYILVSKAQQKFGENFWMDVTKKVASLPHPFRFYSAFKEVAGQDFSDFFTETMNDLKTQWQEEIKMHPKEEISPSDYRENLFPYQHGENLYYVKRTLDSHYELHRLHEGKGQKLMELALAPELTRLHYAKERAVYSQFLPHERFGHKGSSDLILLDLRVNEQKKITSGIRAYYPALTPDASSIYATLFNDKQEWTITQFDLEGHALRTLAIKDHKVAQLAPLSNDEVGAILIDQIGRKFIALINLKSGKIKRLSPPARNNINNLTAAGSERLLFEAQYQGAVNIFSVSKEGEINQCTNDLLGAYTPSATEDKLFYSNQDYYGSHISESSLVKCGRRSDLFTHYLGDGPSDNYNDFQAQAHPEIETLGEKAKKYEAKSYGHFDKRLLIPHSWSFLAGSGYGLMVQTDNYLRTLGVTAQVGQDGAEDIDYSFFKIDIKKYYPIISFVGGIRAREVDLYDSQADLDFKEKDVGLTLTIPYIKRYGLYHFSSYIKGHGDYLETSNYRVEGTDITAPRRFFYRTALEGELRLAKDLTYRSLYSPWLLAYSARYDHARAPKNESYGSYRFFHEAQLNFPGAFKHHVFRLFASQEKTSSKQIAYKYIPYASSVIGSVFSRGFDYETVAEYQKLSGNYAFALAYPDLALGGWYYLRRIYANAFFDHTLTQTPLQRKTLNSAGIELEFESNFFRRLPLNFGGRYIYKLHQQSQVGEFYLATGIGF